MPTSWVRWTCTQNASVLLSCSSDAKFCGEEAVEVFFWSLFHNDCVSAGVAEQLNSAATPNLPEGLLQSNSDPESKFEQKSSLMGFLVFSDLFLTPTVPVNFHFLVRFQLREQVP